VADHDGFAARVEHLTKTYGTGQARVVALDDVTVSRHSPTARTVPTVH
jgi:hypothetical protein